MTRVTDWLATHRHGALVLVGLLFLVLVGVFAVASHRATDASSDSPSASDKESPRLVVTAHPGSRTPAPHRSQTGELSRADRDARSGAIDWLRAMPPMAATKATGQPVISRQDRSQPDLYAAALVRALLTQNYATPRSNLLAWVQQQSSPTAEPSVVGLVPEELRPKLAVASVQEGFDGPGPVPSPGVWDALATRHGHTTVHIQRVTEPVNWSAALANSQITDPGITAREVDALVTLHTRDRGRRHTSVTSVALTVNLEGPPVRDQYGLVLLVDYTAKPVSP